MNFGVILAIVAIICCSIGFIICVIESDKKGAIGMFLLVCVNVFMMIVNLHIHNEPQEIQTTIVKDIQEFSVDSTITISGADTTKTYILTYWK